MKIKLVSIFVCLYAFSAFAEDTFNSLNGNLHMPVVTVDGVKSYEVDMTHQRNQNFKVEKAKEILSKIRYSPVIAVDSTGKVLGSAISLEAESLATGIVSFQNYTFFVSYLNFAGKTIFNMKYPSV